MPAYATVVIIVASLLYMGYVVIAIKKMPISAPTEPPPPEPIEAPISGLQDRLDSALRGWSGRWDQ